MKKILLFSFFYSCVLTSCDSDTDDPTVDVNSFTNGVFILNEGNFGGGNASLSFFNKVNDTLTNDVFTTVNEIPLGDVAQSMAVLGDKGYIIVNNSGKIEVVNLSDLTSLGTISGLNSPRFIAFVSNTKAYVSDLYSNTITIFNPENLSITGAIATNGWVEEMVVVNGTVFAAGAGSGYVYSINTITDQITDSVMIGEEPSSLAVDANSKVWVLTTGGFQVELPKLARINPTNLDMELSLNFTSLDSYPGNLQTNADGTMLYFLDGGVYSCSIDVEVIPTTPIIAGYYYKLGVDKAASTIYTSDPLDYNQNGKVYCYTDAGAAIDTFNVGVIPGNFCFTAE
jgi:hypothetical protein